MTVCPIEGHPEMYGLGVRIAFYIHWLGIILITHLSDLGIPIIQPSTLLLSLAVSLGLIIQCADQALEPAEIYILLLLASGMYFPLIPVYVLKLVSCCHPNWDAQCWTNRRAVAPWIQIGMYVEAIIVAGVGLWFWATYIHLWNGTNCQQYGFFLAPVDIKNRSYAIFNTLVYGGFVLVCAGLGLDVIGCLGRNWRRARKTFRKRDKSERKLWWKSSYLLSATVITAITIAAVESTIQYNKIPQMYGMSTTAQLYPVITGSAAIILILLWQRIEQKKTSEQDSSSPSSPVAANGAPFHPRPPPPASYLRASTADGTTSIHPATTASSTAASEPSQPPSHRGPNSPRFPAGWNPHEDPNGRVDWLPVGQKTTSAPPADLEYPTRARTVG